MKSIFSAILFALMAFAFISCSEDDPVSDQHDHAEAEGLVIKYSGNTIMRIFEGEFDDLYAKKITLDEGSSMPALEVFFLDHDGDEFQTDDTDKSLGWLIGDETVLKLIPDSEQKWMFELEALKEGTTDLEIRILHNDHPDFKSPKIPVEVVKL
jgi:hypothetical protein